MQLDRATTPSVPQVPTRVPPGARERGVRGDPRVLRLRPVRGDVGDGVPRRVLRALGPVRRAAGLVRDVRCRRPRPPARRRRVRLPRRPPGTPQRPAGDVPAHGPRDDRDRPDPRVRRGRRRGARPARGDALPAGLRPRRRGHRRPADDDGARPSRPAGLLRGGAGDGVSHQPGRRELDPGGAGGHPQRVGVPRLGLAHPLPAQRRAGGRRHLRPSAGRGDPAVPRAGRGRRTAGTAVGGPPARRGDPAARPGLRTDHP